MYLKVSSNVSNSGLILKFIRCTSHLTAENFAEIAGRMKAAVLRNCRDRLRGISQHDTRHLQAVVFEIKKCHTDFYCSVWHLFIIIF